MRKLCFVFAVCVVMLLGSHAAAKTLRVVNFGTDIPGVTSLDQSFDPDSYSAEIPGKIGGNLKTPRLERIRIQPHYRADSTGKVGYKEGFKLKAITIKGAEPLSNTIKDDLAKVGIDLELEIVSRPEWAKKVISGKMTGKPYDVDMAINLVDNPIVDLAFHAGLFLASPSPWSLTNDPEFDKRFQEALFQSEAGAHVKALEALDQ